jgi:hypothetical protein
MWAGPRMRPAGSGMGRAARRGENANTSEHALLTMYGRILDLGGIGVVVSCLWSVVRSKWAPAVHDRDGQLTTNH